MKRTILLAATGLTLGLVLVVTSTVNAEQQEKGGSFTFHSAYKGVGETTEVSDHHSNWSGRFWGISFNDEGTGLLHQMAWNCPGASEVVDGTLNMMGYCVLRDADGDKIFGRFTGSGPVGGELTGRSEVSGGTGKYAGVQGGWDFQCGTVGPDNQWSCEQQANFKLP